jgi:hypothetical protein
MKMSLVKIWMMGNFGGCGGEIVVLWWRNDGCGDEDDEWRKIKKDITIFIITEINNYKIMLNRFIFLVNCHVA